MANLGFRIDPNVCAWFRNPQFRGAKIVQTQNGAVVHDEEMSDDELAAGLLEGKFEVRAEDEDGDITMEPAMETPAKDAAKKDGSKKDAPKVERWMSSASIVVLGVQLGFPRNRNSLDDAWRASGNDYQADSFN